MSIRLLTVAAAAAALTACASDPTNIDLGATRADTLGRLGPPTAIYPWGSGERLQYSRAPMGFQVTNIDLDASGKVISVGQELDEKYFGSTIQVDKWNRDDVMRTYGRPYEITKVTSFNGDVWTWRYLQMNNRRFLYIYVDPQGIVRRYNVGDDYASDRVKRW
ncbi:hypothetical protein QTI66_24590 [Variovorax sp. J22R133]|uniref:hypothetical protein n=1 Tax=Variovorax brevis TaxID=3053503 RepID=UPI002577D2AE|nr:hypothetical protein [Variovorax sp. J22R133]MDM0115350.1 hypothetical protein [Variovorax sp. J22R133]